MPVFDMTITLGTVIASIVIVAGTWASISRLYSLVDKKLEVFETIIEHHNEILSEHSKRIQKMEEAMVGLSGDLREILGRINPLPLAK